MHELAQHGVQVVSLNPIRTTLEDYFVTTVRGAAAARHERARADERRSGWSRSRSSANRCATACR